MNLFWLMMLLDKETTTHMKAHDYTAACLNVEAVAQIGLSYFRSASDPSLSDSERVALLYSGHSALSEAGGLIAGIKVDSPDRGVASNLDYCMEFMSERNKRWFTEKTK